MYKAHNVSEKLTESEALTCYSSTHTR